MIREPKFWMSMAVFQVLFGLAVFAITRDYYAPDAKIVSAHPSTMNQPAVVWPNRITQTEIARLSSPTFGNPATQDPVEIFRQAEQFFANRQYEQAAESYARLLPFRPNDAEIYNNLGLTLHYLGRPSEALRRLDEGVAADPNHQRIWLTLGYVNSQLGNTAQAREALTKASQIGTDESIRQSAIKMLEALP